jgi:hypothetical protein
MNFLCMMILHFGMGNPVFCHNDERQYPVHPPHRHYQPYYPPEPGPTPCPVPDTYGVCTKPGG